MMKYCSLFLLWNGASAFVITHHVPAGRTDTFSLKKSFSSPLLFSSAQDEDDAIKSTSFSDAGRSMMEAEDEKQLKEMGDFDSNPDFANKDIENMRNAIRERAKSLGVEQSAASKQYIEEARARAINKAAENRPGQLDLSQISTGNEPKRGNNDWDESLPTMMYDPTDELTEQERAEVDEVGTLPIWKQAIEEIKSSKWPDLGTVMREIAIMSLVIAFTGALIINFDTFIRGVYKSIDLIPRLEDIPGQMTGLDLPEGFTNNMNEGDLAKITEEMNEVGKATGAVIQDVMPTTNPDL